MTAVRENTGLVAAVEAVTGFLIADLSLQDTLDRVARFTCQAIDPARATSGADRSSQGATGTFA